MCECVDGGGGGGGGRGKGKSGWGKKRGVRRALRAKVNDSLITGLRIVDSILPVGRC